MMEWKPITEMAPYDEVVVIALSDGEQSRMISSNSLRKWQLENSVSVDANIGIDATLNMIEFSKYKVL